MHRPCRRVIARLTPTNRLTFPLLLNVWEGAGLFDRLDVRAVDDLAAAGPFGPGDVVLFSFLSPQFPGAADEARAARAAGAFTVAGGAHPTGAPEMTRAAGFDAVFAGPAEATFLEFGRALADSGIPDGPGIVRAADPPPLESALPATRLLKTAPPLEIMRGCFHRCRFCTTGHLAPTFRSLDSIRDYFGILRARGTTRVNFVCPSAFEYGTGRGTPGIPIFSVLDLAREAGFTFIECGIFPSELRPDTVTEAAMRELRARVTNRRVTFGAQSGSPARVAAIGRGHDLGTVERAIEASRAAGFLSNVDFIAALPGETPDERAETFAYARMLHRKYKAKCLFHHFFPLAGSAFQYRFPAWLGESEKADLAKLAALGAAADWWVADEQRVRSYFGWMRANLPEYYGKYRS